MDRNAIVTFSDQLREARGNVLRDAEAFDGIIHVVERLGSFLLKRIGDLNQYKKQIEERANRSALAEDIPDQWPVAHLPFSLLYELVRQARNDALHQGAFARRLTGHAIELSLVLEDALRRSLDCPAVGDYMARNPTCAEQWQPISFIRQLMLANSFSFLPVKTVGGWHFVSDLEIANYLGTDVPNRRKLLAKDLETAKLDLKEAKSCTVDTSLQEALRILDGNQMPLLVFSKKDDREAVVGILTPFDLL